MLRSAWDYCVNRKNPETRTQNPETGNWKRETGIKPVIGNQFSVLSSARRLFMSLPVIAIANASTCLTDLQVLTAIPALQRQITVDFRAYWDVDCRLVFLDKEQAPPDGWWQISVTILTRPALSGITT